MAIKLATGVLSVAEQCQLSYLVGRKERQGLRLGLR